MQVSGGKRIPGRENGPGAEACLESSANKRK